MSVDSPIPRTLRASSSVIDTVSAEPGASRINGDFNQIHGTASRNQSKKGSENGKRRRNDSSVMDTNNSSIVSKRSVEKIYSNGEREYYRYFVNKFKRRSPLINRGYWLRMKAVEYTVRRFLAEQSSRRKIVVNLGCGYDPLPFIFLGRQVDICANTTFVDVDFPTLVRNKCGIIEQTQQLHGLLENFYRTQNEDGVLGAGNPYLAVGCDLRNLVRLKEVLQDAADIGDEGVSIIFVAEVSLAYMEPEASQALLEWTATFRDVRFCMLEQHLPDGADHPFAKTMLAHFEKLKTPLHNIGTMDAMKQRFVAAAWSEAAIKSHSLWELWAEPAFLSPEQRRMLDAIEPFDEWEEFALFASHYFLLQAERRADQNYTSQPYRQSLAPNHSTTMLGSTPSARSDTEPDNNLHVQELPGSQVPRRYAALVPPTSSSQDGHTIGLHGGMGTRERLEDCDTYSHSKSAQPIDGPPLRSGLMCHTVTRMGSTNDCLLVGGRTSPDRAFADCWLRKNGIWQKVQSLPEGRYRHCAVSVRLDSETSPEQSLVVYGGKTSEGRVLHEWLLWTEESGWQNLRVVGDRPSARFGAAMTSDPNEGISGILVGGMTNAGRVLNDFWQWNLHPDMSITCQNVINRATSILKQSARILGRFGAQMVRSESGVLLVGGITGGQLLTRDEAIVNMKSLRPISVKDARPIFVGGAVQNVDDGILLLSGGATCFSFGTYWSKSYLLSSKPRTPDEQTWKLVFSKQSEMKATSGRSSSLRVPSIWEGESLASPKSSKSSDSPSTGCRSDLAIITDKSSAIELHTRGTSDLSTDSIRNFALNGTSDGPVRASILEGNAPASSLVVPNGSGQGLSSPINVPRIHLTGRNGFMKYLDAALPIIFIDSSLGDCTRYWTSEYLKEAIGFDRKVVVHSTRSEKLDFQTKNFNYETQDFASFIDAAERGEKVYLRSLSEEAPSQKPTDLATDFPEIAQDFQLPDELAYVVSNVHSTPLRVSGPVNMWLHYDVMANVLCQIRGRKRVILFPPSDVAHLGFEAGTSSSSLDVFAADVAGDSSLRNAQPYEALLGPGDILFIPSTWAHTATPTEGMSVAVNCFFRSLELQKYAAGRDVYGNRDLAAYEKGRKDISKIVQSFADLPPDVSGFYLQRLAMELLKKAKATSASASDHLHSVYAELG